MNFVSAETSVDRLSPLPDDKVKTHGCHLNLGDVSALEEQNSDGDGNLTSLMSELDDVELAGSIEELYRSTVARFLNAARRQIEGLESPAFRIELLEDAFAMLFITNEHLQKDTSSASARSGREDESLFEATPNDRANLDVLLTAFGSADGESFITGRSSKPLIVTLADLTSPRKVAFRPQTSNANYEFLVGERVARDVLSMLKDLLVGFYVEDGSAAVRLNTDGFHVDVVSGANGTRTGADSTSIGVNNSTSVDIGGVTSGNFGAVASFNSARAFACINIAGSSAISDGIEASFHRTASSFENKCADYDNAGDVGEDIRIDHHTSCSVNFSTNTVAGYGTSANVVDKRSTIPELNKCTFKTSTTESGTVNNGSITIDDNKTSEDRFNYSDAALNTDDLTLVASRVTTLGRHVDEAIWLLSLVSTGLVPADSQTPSTFTSLIGDSDDDSGWLYLFLVIYNNLSADVIKKLVI